MVAIYCAIFVLILGLISCYAIFLGQAKVIEACNAIPDMCSDEIKTKVAEQLQKKNDEIKCKQRGLKLMKPFTDRLVPLRPSFHKVETYDGDIQDFFSKVTGMDAFFTYENESKEDSINRLRSLGACDELISYLTALDFKYVRIYSEYDYNVVFNGLDASYYWGILEEEFTDIKFVNSPNR